MIFGYNTDVKAGDTVYHVQTEDRGEKNPVIDSVVCVKGRIVDRHRTPYVLAAQTPETLQALAKQQHRSLVEAIRDGSYKPPDTVPQSQPDSRGAAAGDLTITAAMPKTAPAPSSTLTGTRQGGGTAFASAANWGDLLASEPARPTQTCMLELLNGLAVETEDSLVFRLKIKDATSGEPIAYGLVRALLRDEAGQETLCEASASEEGVAEVRFQAPGSGKATVLFQAIAPRPSDLLRFHLRRAVDGSGQEPNASQRLNND